MNQECLLKCVKKFDDFVVLIVTKNSVSRIDNIFRFLAAKKARKWMTRTKDERAKAMAKSMAKVFNNDQLLNVCFNDIDLHYE